MTKPVTGLTQWGNVTSGSTGDLDDNFSALQDAINDLNTYPNYLVGAGTANALTATLPANITGPLTDGLQLQIRIATTNTGAATFAYNGGGAVNILTPALRALLGGEMVATSIVTLQYSTAAGPAWILQTQAVARGSWTVQLFDAVSAGNMSSTTTTGFYGVSGNFITATFSGITNISTANMAAGNGFFISLPVASNSSSDVGLALLDTFNFPAGTSQVVVVTQSANRCSLRAMGNGVADVALNWGDVTDGVSDIVSFTLTYRT